MTLKIRNIGTSAGILIPDELLRRLRLEVGDTLSVTETQNGIELSPYDPEFERQMELAEEIICENHDLLRKLAD